MIKSTFDKSMFPKCICIGCILAMLVGCSLHNQSELDTLQKDAEALAQMQCAARQLQKERVQLAQKLMNVQEQQQTYANIPSKLAELQSELDSINTKAETLQAQTKVVADSIRNFMNSLWKTTYKDTTARRALDRATEIHFETACVQRL